MAFKLTDLAPNLVRGIVALTPGPIGNVPVCLPLRPLDVPARFDRDAALRFFANADRFPMEAFDAYLGSLVPMSSSIENALGDRGDSSLRIERSEIVRRRPILFIAGDQDQLTIEPITRPIAELLKVPYIRPGVDWDLRGFGHMIPIERGSEAIAERVLAWLNTEATAAA